MADFQSYDVSFCHGCGALLPPFPPTGDLRCLNCQNVVDSAKFNDVERKYVVVFNKLRNIDMKKKRGHEDEEDEEGPTIERTCPKCGYEKMSYAALQLRSADEGQTVFFTCIKCKYKESENS